MTDQNSQFFAILTAVGEAKQANAAALGIPWTFSQMAVGDANGTDPIPSRTQTQLINERRRAPLNQVKIDPTNASVIIAEQIIPETVGGWWVRELSLYDADGDMVAVANCAPTYKPLLAQGSGRTQVIRINLIVSSTANIELKIDPSVVLATREYVDTAVVEALAKLDFKHSVLVATTENIALSGIQTIDGVLLTPDARVLVKNQTAAKDNGIYLVAVAGAWKRSRDADANVEVTPGLFVSVETGTTHADSVWQLTTDAPIVLGTTPLVFEMVAGHTGVVAGTYRSLTVDKNGRVIAGTNPTTLAAYGIGIPSQAEAEAQEGQDNTKPMTVLRVFQAIAKKLGLMAQTGLADATVGKLMLVGAGGLMGAVEPFDDPNVIPWRTGHFGATAASAANGPPNANLGDMVFQEIYNANAAAQHWTCYSSAHKYTRRWNNGAWSSWDEDLTVSSVGALMTATQEQTNAGVDDTKYLTPKKLRLGFVMSFNAQGYVVFPTWLGSLIIQWTSSASIAPGGTSSASWPIAFPTSCVWALAAPLGNGGNGNAGNVVAGGVSTVAVNLYNWGGAINTPARVIGIGV